MSTLHIDHSYSVAEEMRITEIMKQEPFYLLRPKMFPDGDKWCALYGDNVQEGVCGFGDTPSDAAKDFNKNWFRQTWKGEAIE